MVEEEVQTEVIQQDSEIVEQHLKNVNKMGKNAKFSLLVQKEGQEKITFDLED